MPGITLEQAENQLAKYLAAEEAALLGQSSEIQTLAGTTVKVSIADLAAIQAGIRLWQGRVCQLSRASTGIRALEVIPR